MTYTFFTNGSIITAPQANKNFFKIINIHGQNTIRQLINRVGIWSNGQLEGYGDAYIDSTGRENSVDTSATSATFDTNKYKVPDIYSLVEFVVVEATSFGTWTNGTNDTYVTLIDDGKWLVWCDTGTDAVQRAQIHKSLWYGTDGTDQLILDFTSITAIKTSHANDVGKQAHYAKMFSTGAVSDASYTGTFVNTTTNTNCSSWSIVSLADSAGAYSRWEMPSGSTLNERTSNGTNDELGTDLTADEQDNPATSQIQLHSTGFNSPWGVKSITLCVGDITWVAVLESGSNIDFYTTHSIPLMTAASGITDEISGVVITHGIPSGSFSATSKQGILVPLIEDWETGNDIQFSIFNSTGSTGWLACGSDSQLVNFPETFATEPGSVIIKLIGTSGGTVGYPSIRGYWMYTD